MEPCKMFTKYFAISFTHFLATKAKTNRILVTLWTLNLLRLIIIVKVAVRWLQLEFRGQPEG